MPTPNKDQILKRLQSGTQHRALDVQTRNIDAEKRTIEVAFSSETPVNRGGFNEVLDHSDSAIRLDRFRAGGAVLIDHVNSINSQIGVIEAVSIGADRVGRAVVRLGTDALAESILQKAIDGIARSISVGYKVHAVRFEEEREGEPDTYRVTDWEPFELSFVAVPADDSVGVGRSFDNMEGETMPEPIKQESGAPQTTVVVDQAEVKRQAEAEAKRMFEKEQKRIQDIMSIGARHADVGGPDLAAEAIRSETTVQEFQDKILKAISEKRTSEDEAPIQYGQGARSHNREEDDKTNGFVNFGQFARNVVFASTNRSLDVGLEKRAATTFSVSESGPEGGYLIPPQFAQGIVDLALEEQGLLAMAENLPLSGNALTMPKDESTPWSTSGVQAYWEGEAATSTQSKESELSELSLKLRRLTVLVGASDDLLEDATAMSTHLTRKMSTRLEWKVQNVIVNGNGAGQPLGFTNSGALVTQAKETSQTADTIVKENVAKMFGRVVMGAGARLAWLINPDAFNQLITMNTGGELIWAPSMQGAPGGLLLGRPVIMSETCQTLGDKNDIMLVNMAGYQAATKAGGAQMSQSMHLWFDQNLQAFKLVFRMDGKPVLSAPVTPPNSSVTRSHFVTLAARA